MGMSQFAKFAKDCKIVEKVDKKLGRPAFEMSTIDRIFLRANQVE